MAIFTLNYEEHTGESRYISTLPLTTVLLLVNQLIANEAVKNALDEAEKKKSTEKLTVLTYADAIAKEL